MILEQVQYNESKGDNNMKTTDIHNTSNRKKADTLEYYVRIWKSTTNKEVKKEVYKNLTELKNRVFLYNKSK